MTLQTRVFNPRAGRGGGGLIAQVTIPADEVDQWCQPSAINRARFARSFDRVTLDLRREVERTLQAECDARIVRDRAVALGDERLRAIDVPDAQREAGVDEGAGVPGRGA